MKDAQHAKIVSFIWNIADDVLRDVYVRGKYRDVILPMTVLRRLDAVLEPGKDAVLAMKLNLDEASFSANLSKSASKKFSNSGNSRYLRDHSRASSPATQRSRCDGSYSIAPMSTISVNVALNANGPDPVRQTAARLGPLLTRRNAHRRAGIKWASI